MSVPTAEVTNALASTTYPDSVVTLGVSGLTGVGIQISGTFVGTVVFECSTDGRTFNSLYLAPVTSATPTPAASATATGYWSGSVVAKIVQCRMSAYTSGAAVITMLGAPMGNAAGGSSSGGGDATAANQVSEIADLDKLVAQIVDADTGAGQANTVLFIPGKPASGGPVAGGTTTNPWNVVETVSSLTGSAPTAATVGTSSASALASNASRKGAVFVNTSANYISLGIGQTAVLYSGVTLAPYGAWVMDNYTFSTAVINAIASAVSSNLAVQELT